VGREDSWDVSTPRRFKIQDSKVAFFTHRQWSQSQTGHQEVSPLFDSRI
jgi:hypothetical protein